ncbi:MAG TPA: tyrosine-type recombinase/integrase [Candidatus Binataceae bacterium]|nr:tyrosine-type recombinase/integrase [Candidatus Binataceae bacterium]
MTESSTELQVLIDSPGALSPIAQLADIPEEEIWLAKQKSARTRRAYKLDVQHFMRTLHITSWDELRQVDHRAVIAWERIMREIDEAEPSTIRRRLAALSSLFKHLKQHHHVENNPVADVERPAINRREGSTLAFSKADAAKILNTPAEDTIEGLRDRAILSVGLQVGLRRAEIATLSVEDLHQNRGFDSLRVVRKGGRRDALAIHPNVAQRIRVYLDAAGHADDLDGPMFRPVRHNQKAKEFRRHMDPDAIDRVLRKHAAAIGLTRGYSAHSMRATFITTALENGATLDDVQRAAGHAEPGTTKLYDRRGYNPEKSASFFATY